MPKFVLLQDNEVKHMITSKDYETAKKKFIKFIEQNPDQVNLSTKIFDFHASQAYGCNNTSEILELFNNDGELFNYWEENNGNYNFALRSEMTKAIHKTENKKYKTFLIQKCFECALDNNYEYDDGINIVNISKGGKI